MKPDPAPPAYTGDPVRDYDRHCRRQDRRADSAVREGRAGACSACQTNVTGMTCSWCGRWTCAECAVYVDQFACPACGPLCEIRAHLGAALAQVTPSDDEIIVEHVRRAHDMAVAALADRRREGV